MAIALSQIGTQSWATTGAKSISISAASAGDVLAFIVGATDANTTVSSVTDNLGGTWTAGPSSPVGTGNLRGVTFYKIAAGGENSISFTIGTGTTGQAIAVRATGFAGEATFESSNENEGGLSSVATSIGTNAASNTSADAAIIALFASDRADTVQDVSRSYSNSFTEIGFVTTSGSRAGAFAAGRVVSAASSYSTTFTTGDSGDEMYSAILVFGDVVSGGANEGSGEVTGIGSLVGAGAAVKSGSGTVSGVGSLPAEGRASHYGSGAVSGVGSLAGEGQAPVIGAAEGAGTVDGIGSLPAQGYAAHYGSGSVDGIGSLVGEGDAPATTAEGSGTIDGVGSLAAQGYTAHSGSGEVTGDGSLSGEGDNGEEARPLGLSPWLNLPQESREERDARVRAQRERMGIIAPVVEAADEPQPRKRITRDPQAPVEPESVRSENGTRAVLQLAEARARRDAELKVLAALEAMEAERLAIVRELEIRRRVALILIAAEA